MEKPKCTKFLDANNVEKNLCITTEVLSTLNADNYCKSKGMDLFTIPDVIHYFILKSFLTNYFDGQIPLTIGNAKNDRRNNWNLFTDPRVNLYDNIAWTTRNANANSCMLLGGAALQAMPYDCTQRGLVVCEF